MLATQCRRQEHDRRDGKDLDNVVLFDTHHTKDACSSKEMLPARIVGVVSSERTSWTQCAKLRLKCFFRRDPLLRPRQEVDERLRLRGSRVPSPPAFDFAPTAVATLRGLPQPFFEASGLALRKHFMNKAIELAACASIRSAIGPNRRRAVRAKRLHRSCKDRLRRSACARKVRNGLGSSYRRVIRRC